MRDQYSYSCPITTRWSDNDVYGHINNVAYYSFFDTAANHFLIHEGGLDIHAAQVIAIVVESKCHYHAPLAYPQPITAGVRVDKLGNRSVTWGIAIFDHTDPAAAASGHFVHVFVDRVTRTPVAIPTPIRDALLKLTVADTPV
jgi:acyl-CoA thioester hydrolase